MGNNFSELRELKSARDVQDTRYSFNTTGEDNTIFYATKQEKENTKSKSQSNLIMWNKYEII